MSKITALFLTLVFICLSFVIQVPRVAVAQSTDQDAASAAKNDDDTEETEKKKTVAFKDSKPKDIYTTFCNAAKKAEWETSVKCLSETGVDRLLNTSIDIRKLVEKLSTGATPKSLSKRDQEKLTEWSDSLNSIYEDHDVGLDVNVNVAKQTLLGLKDDQQKAYLAKFLNVYTGKLAPSVFRDRMKTLWYTGRVRVKNKYEENGDTVEMMSSGKKPFSIEVTKSKDGWRIDGVKE